MREGKGLKKTVVKNKDVKNLACYVWLLFSGHYTIFWDIILVENTTDWHKLWVKGGGKAYKKGIYTKSAQCKPVVNKLHLAVTVFLPASCGLVFW